jgi:redox-sensitive bicupin YhaK (pirin superfamily)
MSAFVQIVGTRKDLGGFEVARLLPHRLQRAVGPFIFLDHMGPAQFAPGLGLDVRPHPHIGLATVTFLFSGALLHRDSLGAVQEILPGDVNWMSAGNGIVHSERTPAALRATGGPLHGLQAWVALPQEFEESAPSFDHYPAAAMPRIERAGVSLQLIVGSAYGACSPVRALSPMFYLAGNVAARAQLDLPVDQAEMAIYVVDGEVLVEDQRVPAGSLLVLPAGRALSVQAQRDSKIALLGGAPLDAPRHLWWNFASSRPERIEQARADWQSQRFAQVPGETEFIPLPS